LVRRAVKVKGKLGNCTQVTVYGSLSVITTLEFLEHHFAKVGHRLAPYDPTLFLHTHCRHLARESVCRHAASFKSAYGLCISFSLSPAFVTMLEAPIDCL